VAGSGQTSDLVRLAGRVDTAVLVAALAGSDPWAARTALSLVVHVDDPAPFLPALVELASSRDRDVASRAARAAASLARDLPAGSTDSCVDEQCLLVELDEPMIAALRTALTTPGIGPDIRRQTLSILTTPAGRRYLEPLVPELMDLIEDPDPRVRTAAATLMTPPRDEQMLSAVLDAARDETDGSAGAALLLAACAAMGAEGAGRHEKAFVKAVGHVADLEPPEPALAPIAACLAGIGTPWAREQAARLPGGSK
jgi:hypothetical protein